jgi:hypothetical protein
VLPEYEAGEKLLRQMEYHGDAINLHCVGYYQGLRIDHYIHTLKRYEMLVPIHTMKEYMCGAEV